MANVASKMEDGYLRGIAVFTHAAGGPGHGPNMRWYYLARALVDFGCKVSLVGASWFHKYHSPPDLSQGLYQTINGVNYRWIKTRPYQSRGIGQVLNQADYVVGAFKPVEKEFAHPVDVVVASSPHPLVVFPAARCARRLGVPLVYEVRDLWPRAIMELGGFSRWHPYMLLLEYAERYAIKHAQLVISVKPGDFIHFEEKYGLGSESFACLPNGFFAAAVETDRPSDSEYASGGADEIVVGYVGALSAYYELDVLFDAAGRMINDRRFRFVIVGGGDDEARLRLRAQQERLYNIEFVGMQPKASIPGWLATFDICYLGLKDVSVNRFGISCNKLFEYMAAGKPVIGCYRTEYDPISMARCGITVGPGDVEGLAAAFGWCAAHPDAAADMGQAGREYFEHHHEFSAVANHLHRVLGRLVSAGSQ